MFWTGAVAAERNSSLFLFSGITCGKNDDMNYFSVEDI